jgi:vWA-MoxR associated protein C-terminal domain
VTAVTPEQTSVLAVGLERYDYGTQLDLPGAAEHAARFARWAHGLGVPAERIRLACSWLKDPEQGPLPGAVEVSTTLDGIEDALLGLMKEGGELLLLYWCGHGVTDQVRDRALLASNAQSDFVRSLFLREIQGLLLSTKGRGFPLQVLVIDACANFLEALGADRRLPAHDFGEFEGRGGVMQAIHLSTDLGQIAEYNRREHRAKFSTEVIHWLEEEAGGRSLPPDMKQLRHHVDRIFAERARNGEYRQRPVTLLTRPFSQLEENITYASSPVTGHLHQSQIRLLTDLVIESRLLESVPEPPAVTTALWADPSASLEARVRRAFAEGRDPILFNALRSLTRGDESRTIAFIRIERSWLNQYRIAPLLRTFGRVTDRDMRIALRAVLPFDDWTPKSLGEALDRASDTIPSARFFDPLHRMVATLECLTGDHIDDRWFVLDDWQLNELRRQATTWATPSFAHMVIDLSPTVAQFFPEQIMAHARRLDSDGVVRWESYRVPCEPTLAGVRAAVEILLDWLYNGADNFTVGFAVSRYLREQLPEAWPLSENFALPVPIGVEHAAVLHSSERLAAYSIRERWEERAAAVRKALEKDAPTVFWLHPDRDDPDAIFHSIKGSDATLIGLAFLPGTAASGVDAIIRTVLATGAPYIVWAEADPSGWEHLHYIVENLVDHGPFAELPQRLHRLRMQHNNALYAGLRIIWDDPTLLPPLPPPLRPPADL